MGIKANFTSETIRSRFEKFLQVIEKQQIENLQYLGELCVKHAKLIPPDVGFMDQTGNLRSSIGYMVFKNGVAIHEGYSQTKEGSEGTRAGQQLAKKVGSKYPQGIVLVVTAGMNYAVHVESKGRDVLTSAELLAKQELPKMIEKMISNIGKAVNDSGF